MGSQTFVNDRFRFSISKNIGRGLDVPLLLTVIALSVFGLIMLYSASFDFSFNEYGSSTYMFLRQLRWLGIGIVAAFALSLAHGLASGTDSSAAWAIWIYLSTGASVLLLTIYRVWVGWRGAGAPAPQLAAQGEGR